MPLGVKSLIIDVLQRTVGEFIVGLDQDNLKVGVTSGDERRRLTSAAEPPCCTARYSALKPVAAFIASTAASCFAVGLAPPPPPLLTTVTTASALAPSWSLATTAGLAPRSTRWRGARLGGLWTQRSSQNSFR